MFPVSWELIGGPAFCRHIETATAALVQTNHGPMGLPGKLLGLGSICYEIILLKKKIGLLGSP